MDCPPKNVATVEWWLLWRAWGGGGGMLVGNFELNP